MSTTTNTTTNTNTNTATNTTSRDSSKRKYSSKQLGFHKGSKGAKEDNNDGNLWCRYKLADMYHFGYGVEKDEDKYKQMIEDAYEDVKNPIYLNEPFPEICLRLAGIREEQGETDEAVYLLVQAKRFMAERLSVEAFWGHINVMERIVKKLYELIPFEKEYVDFYDLFYLTQKVGTYSIKYKGKKIELKVSEDNGEYAIEYGGKFYRNFGEFCQKAEIENEKFTHIYDEFYDVETKK